MYLLTVALFFACTFLLGFTLSSFAKNSDNFLERNLMRLGFGLSFMPFLGIILNIIRIPADWRIIFLLSAAYPAYYLIKNYKNLSFSLKLTKSDVYAFAMLLLFAVNLYVYMSGAFSYPYLEDDDSWAHTFGIKYVSMNLNVFDKETDYISYINPYPPTYDILLGILHQTNDSVYWTIKFFNALIISLSTIFFYFFVKELSGSKGKALFASFALVAIPAFMSHFIWAISLAVPLYFVAFYALERIKHDKKWWIIAGLVMATPFTATPTHSTYFGLFFVFYIAAKMISQKKFAVYEWLAGLLGVAVSFAFWWLPMIIQHGFFGTLKGLGILVSAGVGALSVGGTGDRVYTARDFFFAQSQNMINNPVGIGFVLSVLAIVGLVFLFLKLSGKGDEKYWLAVVLAWFILAFYAVNSTKLPIKISPFRAWMLLAIPVCMLAAEGASGIMGIAKKISGNAGKYILLILIIVGVYFTSGQQKIAVNTAQWPPGAFWTSGDEVGAYIWMYQNLPKNSHVFTYWNDGPVIGMDMYNCHWCQDIRSYMKTGFNQSAQQTHDWLKSRSYEYIIIDGQTVKYFGMNETNSKLNGFGESGLYRPVFQNNGAMIFKV